MNKTTLMAILVIIFVTVIVVVKESREDLSNNILDKDAVILAFGDSLTHGFGASTKDSYPAQLEKKTGFKVINAGVNGETTSEGLLRLPKFLQLKPDLVILCHGGNDIMQKLSSKQLKSNLLSMIALIQKSGSKVLLVGVPDFSLFGFDTHEVYAEVVDESGVFFEDDVLTHIELHRGLKSDYVHPNYKGYEMMADAFIKVLQSYKVLARL